MNSWVCVCASVRVSACSKTSYVSYADRAPLEAATLGFPPCTAVNFHTTELLTGSSLADVRTFRAGECAQLQYSHKQRVIIQAKVRVFTFKNTPYTVAPLDRVGKGDKKVMVSNLVPTGGQWFSRLETGMTRAGIYTMRQPYGR